MAPWQFIAGHFLNEIGVLCLEIVVFAYLLLEVHLKNWKLSFFAKSQGSMDLLSEVIYTKNSWIGIFEVFQPEKQDGFGTISEFFNNSAAVFFFEKIPNGKVPKL